MIHKFKDKTGIEAPTYLNNPFRYAPHPLVYQAAEEISAYIDSLNKFRSGFSEGKMIGVLIVKDPASSEIGYLAAFSGNVCNKSHIDGFVPPIFDLTEPSGHFRIKEAEITSINKEISRLRESDEFQSLQKKLADQIKLRDQELETMRAQMASSKLERARKRAAGHDNTQLIRESQFEKAEFKRLKDTWKCTIENLTQHIEEISFQIEDLKKQRSSMSDELQEWIFKQYRVHNAEGTDSTIHEIFTSQGLTPPGGTGDCAAPKLLEYAYTHNLKPLSMGEFWYGTSPDTAVRTHGHFFPSCTSKCGPLLGFMLRGLHIANDDNSAHAPSILHEDDLLIAISKPSGMPSVPGLDGSISAQEWLTDKLGQEIHAVHRLDMDTSGVLLFTKDRQAATQIREQFEKHTIQKTYIARLSPAGKNSEIDKTGKIELPLSPDYDERPRQKVDINHGKEASTEYEIISHNSNGTSDIVFHPITGRTHQLRVHSAHHLGLGRPILGDLLYGGHDKEADKHPRLHLHAQSITFTHPGTNQRMTIENDLNSFVYGSKKE